MKLRPAIHLFAVLAVLGSGCSQSPEMARVTGTVQFDDGQPVGGGTIEFETVGRKIPVTATGEIGADGRFTLGTYGPNDGVLPGQHRAVVVADFGIGTEEERPKLVPKSKVHKKHRSFETSNLQFDIGSGEHDLTVVVEYAE